MIDFLAIILMEIKDEYGVSNVMILGIILGIWGIIIIFKGHLNNHKKESQQNIKAGDNSTNIQINGSDIDV